MNNKFSSIIIPYRDRADHLRILLPALVKKFEGTNYEIIVSEQNDTDSFRLAAVVDIGFQYSSGNTIILQQVDYIPSEDVSYTVTDNPVLPARRGIFLNVDNKTLRPIEDIPSGYKNWHNEIKDDFHGGVICMKREHFEKINGLNPLVKAWGNEDDELRDRLNYAGIPAKRNLTGTFSCLYHEDNNPELKPDSKDYTDFLEGRKLLAESFKNRHIGYKNLTADVEKFEFDLPNSSTKGMWLKSKNYKIII